MIILHVVAAILSLVLSSYNFFKPSKSIMKFSYSIAGLTLASGTSLIFINNASILRTCLTGLVFFAAVLVLNEFARKKLTV